MEVGNVLDRLLLILCRLCRRCHVNSDSDCRTRHREQNHARCGLLCFLAKLSSPSPRIDAFLPRIVAASLSGELLPTGVHRNLLAGLRNECLPDLDSGFAYPYLADQLGPFHERSTLGRDEQNLLDRLTDADSGNDLLVVWNRRCEQLDEAYLQTTVDSSDNDCSGTRRLFVDGLAFNVCQAEIFLVRQPAFNLH